MIETEHDFVTHNWSYQNRAFQLIEETPNIASSWRNLLDEPQAIIDLWLVQKQLQLQQQQPHNSATDNHHFFL